MADIGCIAASHDHVRRLGGLVGARRLLRRPLVVHLHGVLIRLQLIHHGRELGHLANGIVEPRLQLPDHFVARLVRRLRLLGRCCRALALLRLLLHSSKLLAGSVDVSDRTDDLTDLHGISVLTLNLVLEVLL